MTGNTAFGKIGLPLKREETPGGELPHQPPIVQRSSRVRDNSRHQPSPDVLDDAAEVISIRAEMLSTREALTEFDRKVSASKRIADEAQCVASVANWKMNAVIGIAGATFVAVIGGFRFLFVEQQTAEKSAIEAANREARVVMLEARDGMMASLRAERDEAVRLGVKRTLEEQARVFAAQKDPDRITPLQK